MSEKSNGGTFVAGMVVGGLIGTAIGLLVAPRSGRETRRLLKKSADALPELAEDLSTSIQLQTGRLSESALRNWNETLLRLKDSIAAGMEASQMADEQLSVASYQLPVSSEKLPVPSYQSKIQNPKSKI